MERGHHQVAMVFGLGAEWRAMQVDQEPADAGERTLGRPLLPGDDEDRMRAGGSQRGRQPADQERQIGGLDVDVFSQEADRAIAGW
jgi:hypothetical protein